MSLLSCVDENKFRFVSTGLLSAGVQDHVKKQGVGFADTADAASAVLKIASDPRINGGL